MKKYLSFVVVAGLIFSFSLATFAKAEDGSNTNSNGDRPAFNNTLKDDRDDFRDQTKTRRDEFKQQIDTERKVFLDQLKADRVAFMAELKAKKDEWKTAQVDKKARFCQAAKEMVTRKFETVISQLESFQTKAGEMITQLNTDGKDTTLAKEALDLSKKKLADAKTKLLEIKNLIPTTCENVTADVFEKVKIGARDAKDLLKESREALHQSVKEIRALKDKDDDEDSNNDNDD